MRLSSLILLLAFAFTLNSCGDSSTEENRVDPAFSQYISAFSSGVVSRTNGFTVRLSEASELFTEVDGVIEEDLFDFSPSVEGTTTWLDNQTIQFQPSEMLESGTQYEISFALSKVTKVEDGFEDFEFTVSTLTQSFSVNVEGLSILDPNSLVWNSFAGQIRTIDFLEDEKVEELLNISQGSDELEIKWSHDLNGREHSFLVDSIERKEDASEIFLEWNGSGAGIPQEDEMTYEIPSINDFKLMETKVVQQPEQHLELRFSDPLQRGIDLKGLIYFENYDKFRFEIQDNVVKAYPKDRQSGTVTLLVTKGVKNLLDFGLKEERKIELRFEEVKPDVRFQDARGTILPSTNGMVMPFEAVNLKAVDVSIIKVFENNIHQFFQVNRYDGTSQMKRVGRMIMKKRIDLSSAGGIDFGLWNKFTLDLSELIEEDPGSIYRVQISYKKAYSLYPCEASSDDGTLEEEVEDSWNTDEPIQENWDYYGEDYYYDDYYYNESDYQQRDNPCHQEYYRRRSGIAKNILASNIGIIAKQGKDRKMLISVSDIRTAEAMSGASIKLYDYQNQFISESKTKGDGMVEIELEKKPFLLVATKGEEKAYLRLDDGSALSTSHFDVRGEVVQKGIKGFVYSERGVWRPGDTLFLGFILEDKNDVIPENHPVKLELYDARGELNQRIVKTSGLNGFYTFRVTTDPEAPTGNWRAVVKVGSATFTKYLRIETVKPNRLKIKLDFDQDFLSPFKNPSGKMKVTWLHGAKAKNLKSKIAVTLSPGRTAFEGYEKYSFMDPVKNFQTDEQIIFEGSLDAEGEADIPTKLEITDAAPGMLRASFVTRVFEAGGDYSIDRFSIPYSPFSKYLGVKLPKGGYQGTLVTDTNHLLDIVLLDEDGNPASSNNVEVRIYKMGWRWWWDASNDYMGAYLSSSSRNLVHTGRTSVQNGKGSYSFKIEYPNWGRYMVRVIDGNGGHSTGKIFYLDWPSWVSRGSNDKPGGANMLSFNLDKENYKVGEKASVSIPASGKGRALVTIENGSEILKAEWLEVDGKEFNYSFEVNAEMAPNAYLNVTLVQPHLHDNDLPIRMYGVVPIFVENPATKLQPVLKMPDELAPETNVTVKVSEKEGKPMTYTIAVVDEGLLDLTRFKTPNPHPVFYAREALGVKTWDLYDYVIGAYGGKLERILSIGGDEGSGGKDKEKISRFKPMVRFIGPFELGKKDENEHVIDIPNYIGSVRTMVIAGEDRAYGSTEKTTPVKKPLMVLATLPRVLGPGEKVKLPVTVFAMDKKVKKVQIKVKANGLFKSGYESSKDIVFTEPDDQVVEFDLEVAARLGKATVHVEVSGGGEKSSYDIELEVRTPNPAMVKFQDAVVDAGKTWTTKYDQFGIEGTNSASLELSNMPPIEFERRIRYLIDYPHGCVEQTTSRAFPQLYLKDVMEADPRVFERASDNVKYALDKLRSFQRGDGGFGFWPGANNASDWGTSYACHFVLEAEAKGFVIPAGLKDKVLNYQSRVARSYTPTKDTYGNRWNYLDNAQAYRLFTLALAGKAELGSMNRLKAENNLSKYGLWRLAAAYFMAGQQEVAKQMVAEENTYVSENNRDHYTYGSQYRNKAMILEAMSIMGLREQGIGMMKQISDRLTSSSWMSTQATAYSLLAMVKYGGENGVSKEMRFAYKINSEKEEMTTLLPLKQIKIKEVKGDSGSIELENKGTGILFSRLVTVGVPLGGEEESYANNLKLYMNYTDMEGNYIDVTKLDQGTDFMATVTIENTSHTEKVPDMALTQIFPSGWEIHNTRMDEGPNVHEASVPEYQDIRDDRVYTYFSLNKYSSYNEKYKYHSKTFNILLNAAYVGRYYLPGVKAEAMYDNRIGAMESGKWVEVVKPGSED